MVRGWRYRIASVLGALSLLGVGLTIANHPIMQTFLATAVPLLNRLDPVTLTGGEFLVAYGTTAVIFIGGLYPLFKPKPRRILDTLLLAQKRVIVSVLGLAALGYFDYTYRLPRTTLILTGVIAFSIIPLWFVWLQHRPTPDRNAILVGNDPEAMNDIYEAADQPIVGYVSTGSGQMLPNQVADGGQDTITNRPPRGVERDVPHLGGFARLGEFLVEYDVGTAYLAFTETDRSDFFGVLDTCYDHGVEVKVHREHAAHVLTGERGSGPIVDVDLEPLDVQDYLLKRVFDVVFSVVGLVVLSPMMVGIAVAIKLDDGGPVLYRQERTAEFGGSFVVYKFRSMAPDGEHVRPIADDRNERITRVGRVLRQTHLDEIPQLVSILTGKMSVVGPRAVWKEEETLLEQESEAWRRRWFVKPGLTGLAQINAASSLKPEDKLRYDIEYIRKQSFWFDVKIVIRQLWIVLNDVVSVLRPAS